MSVHYLTVRDLPPSQNANAVRSHWRGYHTAKKLWQGLLVREIAAQRVPTRSACFVKATVEFTAPDRRRRDADNHEWVVRKALGDALVQSGVLPDDTPDDWSWTSGRFNYERGVRATTVILEVVDPMAGPA